MADRTLLRTLTKKSRMKFGRYRDFTVGDIISTVADYRWELGSCYYNLSMISFDEEVLQELGITEEFRIPKPGKSNSYNETRFFLLKIKDMLPEQEILKAFRVRKQEQKRATANSLAKSNIKFSKGSMQSKNHGH